MRGPARLEKLVAALCAGEVGAVLCFAPIKPMRAPAATATCSNCAGVSTAQEMVIDGISFPLPAG
ncbi:hypothetical protein DPM13_15555 [Paracoccus mutanolyticus]|uniref:Uncharacterized protein n=1 Tax=Paracoccus mutanolyticus TaxID=1499308 RepID=A0ABN5MB84_9RHOB|nr:hypothetical protein DPM13_15555 [Paracoccus mutanolyticus]